MLEKLNKKTIKFKLRRESVLNLKKCFGFKGEGTKDSPVIFDEFSGFLLEITIKTKDLNLVLRNLTISKLRILNSQNIAIENCFIGKLRTVRCKNLAFRNNSIVNARQLLCRSCFFENNSLQ